MRLVVCDDHRVLLEALSLALGNEGINVVATASTPTDALEAVRQHQPDACLLDLTFPVESGLDVVGAMHEASPTTKIVMMSGSTDYRVVAEAVAEGAHGFIGKDRPITAVLSALAQAMDGQLAIEPALLQEALRPSSPGDDPLWVLKFLTVREWEVMHCIMAGRTTCEIATDLGVQRSTARTHVQNLLTKLGVHSRLQAAALMTAHASQQTWPVRLR